VRLTSFRAADVQPDSYLLVTRPSAPSAAYCTFWNRQLRECPYLQRPCRLGAPRRSRMHQWWESTNLHSADSSARPIIGAQSAPRILFSSPPLLLPGIKPRRRTIVGWRTYTLSIPFNLSGLCPVRTPKRPPPPSPWKWAISGVTVGPAEEVRYLESTHTSRRRYRPHCLNGKQKPLKNAPFRCF
jgi:hypothetical protein